ncbi:hypothetical protein HSX37_16080|uniref:Uncharacterized protein n=1 Tax=Dendrosporobacter quercicolus TaxID=146817 RepID=A0A1G9ZPG6_9FIRM|nr:hypothetical protein [Dendrosporobacter quercicolus]NSL49554.1 hypothetical protein [Dendrosporobacter quercicolus DSM 1736]SDN22523.1 hypothetical protein SAMN04488502_1159 [Dendrosporobacter quercicolus]
MFWRNIRQVFSNLPLVLSESYDPKDISLNRVIIAMLAITVIVIVYRMLLYPETAVNLTAMLDKVLTALGLQLGSNTIKRGLDTWRQVKGGNENAQSNINGASGTGFTEQK